MNLFKKQNINNNLFYIKPSGGYIKKIINFIIISMMLPITSNTNNNGSLLENDNNGILLKNNDITEIGMLKFDKLYYKIRGMFKTYSDIKTIEIGKIIIKQENPKLNFKNSVFNNKIFILILALKAHIKKYPSNNNLKKNTIKYIYNYIFDLDMNVDIMLDADIKKLLKDKVILVKIQIMNQERNQEEIDIFNLIISNLKKQYMGDFQLIYDINDKYYKKITILFKELIEMLKSRNENIFIEKLLYFILYQFLKDDNSAFIPIIVVMLKLM